VTVPLLLEFYDQLPQRTPEEKPLPWRIRRQAANERFRKKVAERYNEGTLLRLVEHRSVAVRRAAVLALGLVGTMESNAALAACLHDEDEEVRELTADALWSVWFRGDTLTNSSELQRILRLRDKSKALQRLNELIERAPQFAEAYNQRAILAYRQKQYPESVQDCIRVLDLNPFHFGAAAGMGQCYLQMRRYGAALKAFRLAIQLHPHLEGVADTIRAIEENLGGEGKRDDRTA
jgi:tetratricopeptide (TPR) repeat protein